MFNNKSCELNVLIADDEEHIRKYLSLIIKDLSFDNIYNASNGGEAIQLCEKYSPCLILLDIIMPRIDGLTALKAIRKKNSSACIIMLTSVDIKKSIQQCAEYGASNYILKGANQCEIIKTINYSLDKYLSRI